MTTTAKHRHPWTAERFSADLLQALAAITGRHRAPQARK